MRASSTGTACIKSSCALPVCNRLGTVTRSHSSPRGQVVPSRLLTAEGTLYGPERRAAIQWPLKLMVEVGTGRRRLYNLERDPGEQTDLAPTERRAVRFLSDELRNTLTAAREGVQSEDVPLDEEMLEELRSLGYIN